MMRSESGRRRTIALVLGVAVPVLLLGLGWLASSLRERAALEREQRALLTRTAAVARGAVDESLEELRRREDARPFYLYNHYYTPPDVFALSDPVAISPLAGVPDDPRIVGYFQVDPGGAVRTPYENDGGGQGDRETEMTAAGGSCRGDGGARRARAGARARVPRAGGGRHPERDRDGPAGGGGDRGCGCRCRGGRGCGGRATPGAAHASDGAARGGRAVGGA